MNTVTDLVEDGHILALQHSGFMSETWRTNRLVTMATGVTVFSRNPADETQTKQFTGATKAEDLTK